MAAVVCILCLHPIRRRWWQWGPLAPLKVHTWTDADECQANRRASRAPHPTLPDPGRSAR